MSSQYISHLGLGNNFPPVSLLGHQAAGDVHVPSGVHSPGPSPLPAGQSPLLIGDFSLVVEGS